MQPTFFSLGDFNVIFYLDHHQTLTKVWYLKFIYEPTNFTIPNGSCIDLIIANNTGIVYDSFVNPTCCSTHSIAGVEVKFHIMKHYAYQRVIRDYNNAIYVGLNNDLTGTNWEEEVFNAENINEINSNFTNIITSCIKKRIPTKVITIRPRDKAFKSNLIRKFMRKRNRKHRKAAKTQNPHH